MIMYNIINTCKESEHKLYMIATFAPLPSHIYTITP